MALKVLPQAFTDDPERLARFEREATVLASLNHPNIGHIYGLEEAEDQKALVHEQALVDRFFHQFVDTVAKGRQAAGRVVTAGMIKRDWGARIYTAEQAVEIGMADRVATLDQVVAQLAGRPAPARTRAVSAVVSTEQTRRLNADRRRRARTRLALA